MHCGFGVEPFVPLGCMGSCLQGNGPCQHSPLLSVLGCVRLRIRSRSRIVMPAQNMIMILILILILSPRSLRPRPRTTGETGAMEDILRRPAWDTIWYLDAQQGMWPLSWRRLDLGPSTRTEHFHAEPLRRLEEQHALAYLRYVQQCQRLASNRKEAASADEIWRINHDLDELHLADARGCVKRREEAWHYGMLLCRAFFQPIAMDQIPQEQFRVPVDRLSPEIVQLIEQFLNYE